MIGNLGKKAKKFNGAALLLALVLVLFIGLIFFLIKYASGEESSPKADAVVSETPSPGADFSAVEGVAESYGIPAGTMERLAGYLAEHDFNGQYGGVGLFSVKPSHLSWIKDSILADTQIDLEDPIQNTQVAASLLRRFHDAGYSWKNCFLIFTYGFPAVNSGDKYADFLSAVFGE